MIIMIIWQRKAFSSHLRFKQFSIQCPAAAERLIINLLSSENPHYLRTLSMFNLVASRKITKKNKKQKMHRRLRCNAYASNHISKAEYSCDVYVE